MKPSLWIWVLVIVVLVIAGVFLFRSKDAIDDDISSDSDNTTLDTSTTGGNGSPVAMKTSLGGIFDEKGNWQCDYEKVNPQSRSTNVVYISNGKLRGEFRTITATNSTNSIVLYDGSYLYVWTEGKGTGTITQPKTIKDLPALIPEDITSGRVLGSGLNNASWNCHAWSLDAKKLVKPTNVTFN